MNGTIEAIKRVTRIHAYLINQCDDSQYRDEAIRNCVDAVMLLETAGLPWVPVGERLPERGCPHNAYSIHVQCWDGQTVFPGYCDTVEGHWFCAYDGMYREGVLKWLEITPPREGGGV